MRTYERTHPWISFQIDLRKVPPDLWIALGEAASKCEHLSRVPLRPATSQLLHRLYLAKGVAATTAIEGNTLSEEDVLKAVDGKLDVPPSKAYLKQEVENIIEACNLIGSQLASGMLPPVTPKLMHDYNRQVLNRLPLEEGVTPGKLRTYSVVVGNVYRGAPAEDCEHLLERLCDWLNGPDFKPREGMDAVYAILKAVVAHLHDLRRARLCRWSAGATRFCVGATMGRRVAQLRP